MSSAARTGLNAMSSLNSVQASLLDLGAPAAVNDRLAAAVREEQLLDRSPCPGMDVAGLLAHLLGLSIAFRDAAAKVAGPTTQTPPAAAASVLPEDWRQLLPVSLHALAAAWRSPSAWSGTTLAGGVELPGDVMGTVANNELVLHGWDLAVATGQPFEVAPANLEACWRLVRDTPDDPAVREGLFGPVVPVDPDAPLLDRVLGGAGRNPHWAPA